MTPQIFTANDDPYINQVFGSYLYEAMALLGETIDPATIEQSAMALGMPAGPLAVLDELSLNGIDDALHRELHELEHGHDAHEHKHDHSHSHSHSHDHDHGHKHSHSVKSKRMPESAVYVLEKMAHGFKRTGRDNGAGFYDYLDGEDPELWDGLSVFTRGTNKADPADNNDRLLYIQALRSVQCVASGTISSVATANALSISEWGFPANAGGTIAVINSVGAAAFCKRADELAKRYGERFSPCALLRQHGESDQQFS